MDETKYECVSCNNVCICMYDVEGYLQEDIFLLRTFIVVF